MTPSETGKRTNPAQGRRLALVLLILATVGLGIWAVKRLTGNRPVQVLLVAPPPESEAEMSHYQARAIALLVQDALEANPRISVTLASDMPLRPEELKRGTEWLLVKALPRRRQDRLASPLNGLGADN